MSPVVTVFAAVLRALAVALVVAAALPWLVVCFLVVDTPAVDYPLLCLADLSF